MLTELGFSVGLWNGQAAEVGLSVLCGTPAAIPGMVSNTLVLNLPEAEGNALALYRRGAARAVLRAVVTAWQPSWCTWTNERTLFRTGRFRRA